MRLRTSAFLVLLLTASFAPGLALAQSPPVSHWEKIGPVNFTALAHQSPTKIVAATDHGYLYSTTDDGTTWQRQIINDTLRLTSISFGDSLHGALLASGNLMLTTDGGASWHGAASPQKSLLMAGEVGADTLIVGTFPFGDPSGQHLCCMIIRSIDGGTTWDTVSVDSGYCFAQKLRFFFGVGFAIGQNFCMKTTDDGAHWSRVQLRGGDTALYPNDIDFYSPTVGAVAAGDGYYVTTNGGTTWAFTPEFHDLRNDSYSTVTFFGPTNFCMFGTPNAYVFTSNDLGDSSTITLSQLPEASSISNVIQTENGWLAMGSGGHVLRGTFDPENMTTPSWQVLAECPFASPVSLHASNGSFLQCMAGSYPIISTDSGFFWHVTDNTYPEYSSMHFSSMDTGYLYHNGWLSYSSRRTTDSGRTWKPYNMIPTSISQPTFGSPDTGYGISGSLQRTTDGGLTWQPDSIPFPNSPFAGYTVMSNTISSIASPDGMHAFVLFHSTDTLIVPQGRHWWDYSRGRSGIYQTSDAGTTWRTLTSVDTLGTIRGMYFRTASFGFLLGDSGRLYRTTDGGDSWRTEHVTPIAYTLNSINFLNDRIGFLTVDTEAVLETTDGGLHWSWSPIPTNGEEIANRQMLVIYNKDTIPNHSGMSMREVFFPDSNTVLVAFVRTLVNFVIPPKTEISNGDTFVVFDPSINTPNVEADYGFYRGKLNFPQAAVQAEEPVAENELPISVYPNPVGNELHVEVSTPIEHAAKIDVLDMLGRPVLSASEASVDFSLDLHTLPSGVYTLRCKSGNRVGVRSFAITR